MPASSFARTAATDSCTAPASCHSGCGEAATASVRALATVLLLANEEKRESRWAREREHADELMLAVVMSSVAAHPLANNMHVARVARSASHLCKRSSLLSPGNRPLPFRPPSPIPTRRQSPPIPLVDAMRAQKTAQTNIERFCEQWCRALLSGLRGLCVILS
jgi:hypothetical protein